MRLWHYKLIPYLPKSQLIAQWRECVSIAKNLHDKGTPNHILVNPILGYPREDFNIYCNHVLVEMICRGINVTEASITKLEDYIDFEVDSEQTKLDCFDGWMDNEYLTICYYNLKEKYLRGQKDFDVDRWTMIDKVWKENVR